MSRATDGQAAEGVISLRAHEEKWRGSRSGTSARLWPCVAQVSGRGRGRPRPVDRGARGIAHDVARWRLPLAALPDRCSQARRIRSCASLQNISQARSKYKKEAIGVAAASEGGAEVRLKQRLAPRVRLAMRSPTRSARCEANSSRRSSMPKPRRTASSVGGGSFRTRRTAFWRPRRRD